VTPHSSGHQQLGVGLVQPGPHAPSRGTSSSRWRLLGLTDRSSAAGLNHPSARHSKRPAGKAYSMAAPPRGLLRLHGWEPFRKRRRENPWTRSSAGPNRRAPTGMATRALIAAQVAAAASLGAELGIPFDVCAAGIPRFPAYPLPGFAPRRGAPEQKRCHHGEREEAQVRAECERRAEHVARSWRTLDGARRVWPCRDDLLAGLHFDGGCRAWLIAALYAKTSYRMSDRP
jgi:hypothetical protein